MNIQEQDLNLNGNWRWVTQDTAPAPYAARAVLQKRWLASVSPDISGHVSPLSPPPPPFFLCLPSLIVSVWRDMLGLRAGPLNYLSASCPVKWVQQIQPTASCALQCALPLEAICACAVQPTEYFAHLNRPNTGSQCWTEGGHRMISFFKGSADDLKKRSPLAIFFDPGSGESK